MGLVDWKAFRATSLIQLPLSSSLLPHSAPSFPRLWHLLCFQQLISPLTPGGGIRKGRYRWQKKPGTFPNTVLHMYVPIMSSPLPFGQVIKVFTWNKSDKPLPASWLWWCISFNQKQQGHAFPSPEDSRCIIWWGRWALWEVQVCAGEEKRVKSSIHWVVCECPQQA